MQFPKVFAAVVVFLSLLVCISCSKPSSSSGTDGMQEQMVALSSLEAASLAAFSNVGTDRLVNGSVKTEGEEDNPDMDDNDDNDNDIPNGVKFQLTQAMAIASYAARFCPFSGSAAACMSLGSVTTDAMGDAEISLKFPQTGTFAGVFLLTRNNQPQFVSGFSFPGTGSEGEGNGNFEADLQQVGLVSGGLGFGTSGTDRIKSGQVEVNSEGNSQGNDDNGENEGPVEVKLNGGSAGTSYSVEFCRFGAGASGCVSIGTFSTDQSGNAHAEFAFPLTGTFDGVFVLTRMVNNQTLNEFVTGFQR